MAFAVRSWLAAVVCLVAPSLAHAQPPFAAPPPPPAPPPAEPLPPAPPPPPAPPAPPVALTDHQAIVGHWGLEARQIGATGVFQRTPGNDGSCGNNCPILLN